jgi:apolipoprotein N-acyltransferase
VGGALLAALCVVARRDRQADATAFLLGVLAILAFSPIVWQHYLVLALVPLAVLHPGFSRIWLVPSLLWLTPDSSNVARPRELVMFAVVLGAVSARGLWHARVREAAAARPPAPTIAGTA